MSALIIPIAACLGQEDQREAPGEPVAQQGPEYQRFALCYALVFSGFGWEAGLALRLIGISLGMLAQHWPD